MVTVCTGQAAAAATILLQDGKTDEAIKFSVSAAEYSLTARCYYVKAQVLIADQQENVLIGRAAGTVRYCILRFWILSIVNEKKSMLHRCICIFNSDDSYFTYLVGASTILNVCLCTIAATGSCVCCRLTVFELVYGFLVFFRFWCRLIFRAGSLFWA